MQIYLPARKTGMYWEDCKKVIQRLKKSNFEMRYKKEKEFEGLVVGSLQTIKFNQEFIDQRSAGQPITRVTLFGKDHRADMSVGTDGTAIEVKLVKNGDDVRTAIGQGLFYRTGYRFVILLLVDAMSRHTVFESIHKKGSLESLLLEEFKEINIFVMCVRAVSSQ